MPIYECPDMHKLNYILSHQDLFKRYMRPETFEGTKDKQPFSFETLQKYADLYDQETGLIEVKYNQHKIGNMKTRQFAKYALSMQSFPRIIRGTIAESNYTDIDMVNAHPVILKHLCDLYNDPDAYSDVEDDDDIDELDTTFLSVYINDRNKTIDEIIKVNPELTTGDIKIAILALINGGISKFNQIKNKTNWLNGFSKEIKKIHETFWNWRTDLHKEVRNKRDSQDKSYNYAQSLMNQLLCEFENKILMEIVKYLKSKNRINKEYVLCFDGIMIPKISDVNTLNGLLRDLECHIFKRLNIRLQLANKKMETFDNLPNFDMKIWDNPIIPDLKNKQFEDLQDELFSDIDIDSQIDDLNEPNDYVNETLPKLTSNQIKAFIKNAQTDGDFADHFIKTYPDTFKLYRSKLYYYNGVYWEEAKTNSILFNKLDIMYWKLKKNFDEMTDLQGKEALNVFANIQKLRMTKPLKNIIEAINTRIEIDEDIFDKDADLLGFTNGTYDLKEGKFRNARKKDYISRVIPYEYKPYDSIDDANKNLFDKFINTIFPIEEERNFALKCLSAAFYNKLTENILFFQGNGRNGKDTLMNSIRYMFGDDLYYAAPNYLLTEKIKTGANPEIANMHKKRIIVYSEPDSKATLKCNVIKELTGCETMPIRGLYQADNKTSMVGLHCVLQNDYVALDQPDDAIANRIVIIPFHAMFRTEEILAELPSDTKYTHVVNSFYKTSQFMENIKYSLLHKLLDAHKEFRKDGCIIKGAPKSIRELGMHYVNECNEMFSWFRDHFEVSNDINDFIKLKDVYAAFKHSDLWLNMPKQQRRTMTKDKFEKAIKTNPAITPYYKDRYHPNQQIDITNVLIKYKYRSDE